MFLLIIEKKKFFSFSRFNELRREESCCAEAAGSVRVDPCLDESTHKWDHIKGGSIREKRSGLCLDVTGLKSGDRVKMNKCDESAPGQRWRFDTYSEPNEEKSL
jgi:hypothetical protein